MQNRRGLAKVKEIIKAIIIRIVESDDHFHRHINIRDLKEDDNNHSPAKLYAANHCKNITSYIKDLGNLKENIVMVIV